MAITPGTENILAASKDWKDRSLIGDKSVFSDEALWTLPHLDELQRHFVENPDVGKGSFTEKLRKQIAPVSPGAKRLTAELLWVMMLFPSKTNVAYDTKVGLVREIWSWSGAELSEDEPLLQAPLEGGIGSGGRAYSSLRWAELAFFIQFLRRFKSESPERRRSILEDPWVFANYVDKTEGADRRQFRHMLLHLLFPRAFERISSGEDRGVVDEYYSSLIPEPDLAGANGESAAVSLDRRLAQIRKALNLQDSEDFYSSARKAEWKGGDGPPPEPDEQRSAQASLEQILSDYTNARSSEPFKGSHPVTSAFRDAKTAIDSFTPVKKRRSLQVGWSAGQGNWARVPWISLLDTRETATTKRGVYCVYLFRQDMSGAYLTYNQGVTDPLTQLGRARGRQFLRDRATQLRKEASALEAAGFRLDDRIDLRVEGGLGGDYEDSTVAYKLYEVGRVPNDSEIERDLSAVLSAYDTYLERTRPRPEPRAKRNWIFQANPDLFDVRGASAQLKDFTWLVRQHTGQVASGDRVYLWESGSEAGIVATATVVTDPALLPLSRGEEGFVRGSEEKFEGNQLRVRIKIDKRVNPALGRSKLLEVPGLRELSILRQSMGTNFPVTPEQAVTIDQLINDAGVGGIVEPRKDLRVIHQSFAENLTASHISFGERHDDVTRAFISSLAAKPFLVLTGLSGSGKTQIALKFGQWCGEENLLVVPVRPDWTGAESLFGYEDALIPPVDGERVWHVPDALAFMLRAAEDPTRPYILVLDEMNLAHVERYFADVLSGMESGVTCLPNLRKEGGYWLPADPEESHLRVPDNLFIIGTVNVDETTYTFSPKVLDRANTIEFRVGSDDMSLEAKKPVDCDTGAEDLVRGFLAIARDNMFHQEHPNSGQQNFRDSLRDLHSLLSDGGFEFGHRVFYESVRFAAMYEAAGGQRWEDALDLQVLQKLLPRLHGSRRRLEPTLNALADFCVDLSKSSQDSQSPESVDILSLSEATARLPRSLNKLKRMTRNLRANQFASFTE